MMEGMWTRFFPVVRAVRERLARGDIGEVVAVQADFGFRASRSVSRLFEPAEGGGALLDIGIYPLAAASLAAQGEMPAAVRASGLLADTGVDVANAIALDYGGRLLANITVTLQARTPEETVYIGTKGHMRICTPAHAPTKCIITNVSWGMGWGEGPPFLLRPLLVVRYWGAFFCNGG